MSAGTPTIVMCVLTVSAGSALPYARSPRASPSSRPSGRATGQGAVRLRERATRRVPPQGVPRRWKPQLPSTWAQGTGPELGSKDSPENKFVSRMPGLSDCAKAARIVIVRDCAAAADRLRIIFRLHRWTSRTARRRGSVRPGSVPKVGEYVLCHFSVRPTRRFRLSRSPRRGGVVLFAALRMIDFAGTSSDRPVPTK